ncbi:MerR family transcriptional regulator [Knoellia sp. Soil729]|uniref:MerR family transcriptional regulator n=1 Tax=Knoellia sp. Soil729 TaxID=1736394 RepID=UPI0006FA707F|nr:MerR family transcriptional regulator [Knoellia sp. Soil729]KRE42757.1 MerR family transcriptional regulator [Knoellia sp. Soil729]
MSTEDSVEPARSMHIGEVAERTELSLRSLRHWDEVGLLRPSGRTDGGFRLYTEADVDKILVIRRMKPLGFTLDEMSAAMRDLEDLREPASSKADRDAAHARLATVLAEAGERRARLETQLAMADEFLDLLGRELHEAHD